MESKNRTVWIVLGVVAIMACCGVLVVAAIAVAAPLGWAWEWGWDEPVGYETERMVRTFEVGAAPRLVIDNIAGAVTVRVGESDTIQVTATKKAPDNRDLDRVEVDISERAGGVEIRTSKPSFWSNVSVAFEVTAPAGTRLDLHTGAGSLEVRGLEGPVKVDSGAGSVQIIDVTGEIDARTGAGSIDVRGAIGPVRLNTGAGGIDYQGAAQGNCRFSTGAGTIRLVLPPTLNVEVDLDTGWGSIDVDYRVEGGRISRQEVRGVIGTGDEGRIEAHTGTGGIDLIGR